MIRTGIALLFLISLVSSMSYKQFKALTTDTCAGTINTCKIDFYNSPNVGDEEILCAQDLQKARVCHSTYKQCFPANTEAGENEEVDVVL